MSTRSTTPSVSQGRLRLGGLLLIFFTIGCEYSPESDSIWQAQKAVQRKLLSPGSADFVTSRSVAHTEDEAYYLVYVVVDSQNKFGAVLRSHHLVLMKTNGEDKFAEMFTMKSFEKSPGKREAEEFLFVGENWVWEDWMEA